MYNEGMKSIMNSHSCCPPEPALVVTVQTVDGIKGLNNCFVFVQSTNSVYYVDRSHKVTLISAQPVDVREYDTHANPLNLRNQFAFDLVTKEVTYFTNAGQPIALSSTVSQDDLNLGDGA